MKIACIIHSIDGGGAERVMASLASRLGIRGHAVTLVTLDDARNDRHDVDASVQRHPLGLMAESDGLRQKLFNTGRRIRAVRESMEAIRPDVILSFCDRTNILVLLACGRRSVPVVISERSDPAEQRLGAFWEFQRTRVYRRAARIIALTDTSASHLQSHSVSPVAVIPSAVGVPPHGLDREVARRNQRIVGVGRLEREKGFDRLIRAFATIAEQSPNWNLRILGEGSQRGELERLSDELGMGQRVSMPGWVRPVWNELAEATIFALPSHYEGFPSALLEAMAVGVPSVSVDCESGPRAIMTHQSDGLLIENNGPALSEGIQRMIDDPVLREEIGERGKSVVDRFGWDAMVDRYEQVLQEAYERFGGTGGASN